MAHGCCSLVNLIWLGVNFLILSIMTAESRETLEAKIDFLIDLITEEQYDEYYKFCEESGYRAEGGYA